MDIKEIKSEIRKLKRLKLACRSGTSERIDLHRQILALKSQLLDQTKPSIDKEILIAEILALQEQHSINPKFESLGIDLYKYTVEQLKNHIIYIKRKYTLDKCFIYVILLIVEG